MERYKAAGVRIRQTNNTFLLTRMRALDLARVTYVAERGASEEEGAVQRILNRARIGSIRDFTLAGGDFPNAIVLNWVNKESAVRFLKDTVSVPLAPHSAQIVDGQHRVAGIREAIKSKPAVGNIDLPVAIYEHLTTQQCANIFLSINTEQKPVPRSLVFDLYGVASEYVIDEPALRAKDIADRLNEDDDSPYKSLVKYPGPDQTGRGIALSSVVGGIKTLIEEKGAFEQLGIKELEQQAQILLNWLRVLQDAYGSQWLDKDNVFLYASGFSGAVDFFKNKLLTYCNMHNAFDLPTMQEPMKSLRENLIWQRDVAGMQGRRSTATISEMLTQVFSPAGGARKRVKM